MGVIYQNLPNTTIMELEIVKVPICLELPPGRGLWECKLQNKENYPSVVKTKFQTNQLIPHQKKELISLLPPQL